MLDFSGSLRFFERFRVKIRIKASPGSGVYTKFSGGSVVNEERSMTSAELISGSQDISKSALEVSA